MQVESQQPPIRSLHMISSSRMKTTFLLISSKEKFQHRGEEIEDPKCQISKVNSWVCTIGCRTNEELEITISQMGSQISHQDQKFNKKHENENSYREW